jgi:hypothetical protein
MKKRWPNTGLPAAVRPRRGPTGGRLFGGLAAMLVALCCCCGGGVRDDGGIDLNRPHQGQAGTGKVGAACAVDPDCQAELICVAELLGGFCTRACTSSCPQESLCVTIQLPESAETLACAPLCDGTALCRDGYRCVSVGRRSVCSP